MAAEAGAFALSGHDPSGRIAGQNNSTIGRAWFAALIQISAAFGVSAYEKWSIPDGMHRNCAAEEIG
jgi:hypothetical protein